MMNGQDRHGGVEALVGERQIVGAGLDRLGRCGTTPAYHLARGLDRDQRSIDRFVRTGAGADVEDSSRRPERAFDDACDSRIRPAQLRIIDADDVVSRAQLDAFAFSPRSYTMCARPTRRGSTAPMRSGSFAA